MSFGNRKRKLVLFFEKIFEEDYELNIYHADRILKCLEEASISGLDNKLLDSSIFSDIILKTYSSLGAKKNSVEIFIGKMLSVIFKNELHFNKLSALVSVSRLKLFLCKPNVACAPNSDLLLAFTNVSSALIVHYSGINWLVENKIWQYILCACTHTRPVEVSRAAYRFIAQLILKVNELDYETVLPEIFEFILSPIINNRYHTTKDIADGNEKDIYAPMMSYLNALLVLLSDTANVVKKNRIIPLLTKHFNLELQMQIILDVTRDSYLASVLCELLFKLYFAAVKEAYYKYKKTDSEIMNEITTIYNNVIHKLILKQMSEAVASYVVKCNLFLAKLGAAIKPFFFERDGKKFEFQNQFVLHLVVPLWTYYAVYCGSDVKLDAINKYSFKLMNITAEHIADSAELFQTLVENGSRDVKTITIYTVKNLFQFRGQLNKNQAGILYQGLYYVLKTYVMSDDVDVHLLLTENPLKTSDDFKLLVLVLDAIKMLLKEHHIDWYENVEIINLQETLMNLLKQKCLCVKTLVQTLDLIDISVRKFLSPDMTLLVENKNESSLAEIGAITKEYIEHAEWEVRDSALSLLLSCTQLSFVKYEPFQRLISENKLMLLAANCGLNDPEVYVQVTALQCLTAATKIDKIWREVTSAHPKLQDHLVKMVRTHREEAVRKEAVNVLTEIFVNQNVTNDYRQDMFKIMASVVLKDLNWEVQIAALTFWKHAIAHQSQYRGMIDGKFPSVTFSKEKRKIICFNDNEIKKQLENIMNDLSNIGCLTVLDRCLNGEHNVAVMEEAYKIVTDLKLILDDYNYKATKTSASMNSSTSSIETTNSPEAMDLSSDTAVGHRSEEEMTSFRDNVIEQIINTPENDLIAEVLKKPPDQQSEVIEIENVVTELVQPYDFIEKFQSTDYASIIKDKKNWITGQTNLDDLIDEILSMGNYSQCVDMCDM